jgi:DNA-binding SARP family transcriptional activator
MHWHSSERRYEEALEIGRALVADDPTREALQCSVLWLYVLNGQRGQALRHYDQFRRWLNSDLGIEPMPETQALHDYIRRGLDGQHTTSAIARSSGRTGSDRQNNLPPLHRMVAAVEDSRRAFLENLGDRPE